MSRRLSLSLAAAGVLALLLWEHFAFYAGFSRAMGDALRAGGAAGALFLVTGYAPARLLAPPALRPYALLLSLPVGAAVSGIALAALGLAHVPFTVALIAMLVAGAGAGIAVLAHGEQATPDWPALGERLGWPLLLAAAVAIVALSPVWRVGFGTVLGQNGDAVLAVGSAELVTQAPPTAIRPELPVDRIPLVWRSKYPIFYPLAAVSQLSGLDPIAAFPFVAAAMLGLAALGFFLLARVGLRAPPAAALAAMAAVGLARLSVHVADNPFYNQLWALFALPFILLAGIVFLRRPDRRSLGLLALFAAIGAFAYPLMLPFPMVFLAVGGWRERARLRVVRPSWPMALAALAGLALMAVLVRGVFEKAASAAVALSPWGDLGAWSGADFLYVPFHRAFGLPAPGGTALVVLMLAAAGAAAAYALWRAPRDAGVPLGVTVAAGLAAAIYFRHREQAELFYFKTVGFVGSLGTMLVVLGLCALVRARGPRALAAGGLTALALFGAAVAVNTRRELLATNAHASTSVLELRDWSRSLPDGATVRIDVPPSGYQLWSWYMLADRRVCALRPLVGFFPRPPMSRRADYALAFMREPRPPDAVGRPLRANDQFTLWRLRPGIPGPDVCSRRMIDAITSVNIT